MALTNPSATLPLRSFEKLMAAPLEPVPWLVEPLMASGDRVIVYGEFGAYKSWALQSLALHLAAGRPWLGKFAVPEAKRVLYVDEEMALRLFQRRLRRLAMGMGLEASALPLQLLSRHNVGFDAGGAEVLLDELERAGFDPDVIVIETFRRVFIGDEISAKDVAAFWHGLTPLVRAGKTIIISHHMRKPSQSSGNQTRDRASGSTDILAGADSALAINRNSKDAFIVEHVKCREAEEAGAFAVSFFEESAEGPVELRYVGSPTDLGHQRRKWAQAEQLIQSFLQSPQNREASTEELLAHLMAQGISKSTGERALKNLVKQGRVHQPTGRGSYKLVGQAVVA